MSLRASAFGALRHDAIAAAAEIVSKLHHATTSRLRDFGDLYGVLKSGEPCVLNLL